MNKREAKNAKNSNNSYKIDIDLKMKAISVNSQKGNKSSINRIINHAKSSSTIGPKKKSENKSEKNHMKKNVNQYVNIQDKQQNVIKEQKVEIKYEPILRDDLFEKIKNKLLHKEYNSEDLIKDINILIDQSPIISKFDDTYLLKPDFFEIFDCTDTDKFLYTINLLNYINIINGVWHYSNEKVDEFVNILNELSINFSWVNGDKGFADVILLTRKSKALYNYILTHGENGFSETGFKEEAKKFFIFKDKYKHDFGYCFEDLVSLDLCSTIEKKNYIEHGNVMYYIKKEKAEKLIKLNLVEFQENNIVSPTNERVYHGYNELDLLITMKKEVKIEENCNFNEIINGDLKRENSKIIFEKYKTYAFKTKTNIILEKINHIEQVEEKFFEALKNAKFNNKSLNEIKELKKVLICSQNPIIAKEKIKKWDIKDKNFIYSFPQVGIPYILRLNKNLKDLNKKVDSLKQMVIEKTKEFKNSISALDLRIQKIEKELGIDKKEKEIKLDSFVYKNNLFEMNKKIFENISEVKSTFITDLLKGDVGQLKLLIERKLTSASMAFELVFEQLNEMSKNTSLFYNDIKPFIYGFYKLTDDDAVKSIKKLLEEKISKGAIYSKYYEALKKFLFGIDGKTPNQIFEIILSDEERINIEYLFQFTDVLEKNYDIANIECKYDGAILFVLNDMMNFDDLCSLLTIAKTVNTRNEEIIKTMIICLNKKNLDSYWKNYLKTNGKNNDYSINKKNKNY